MKLLNYLATTLTVLTLVASTQLGHAQVKSTMSWSTNSKSTKSLAVKTVAGPTYPSEAVQLDQMISMVLNGISGTDQGSASGADQFDSGLNLEWPMAPMTEMHQVAEVFGAPDYPTSLFLNFDGQSSAGVAPFESTTGDREKDIQEILFTVSQIFAPFDVKVRRMHTNGGLYTASGATTIFIGDKSGNSTLLEGFDSHLINRTRAYADADYPCPLRESTHQSNSDEYNTGYVDPIKAEYLNGVEINFESWSNSAIGRVVCHEAGHTFGLAHVLTEGFGSDMMSYDSSNRYFNFQDFNITNLDAVVGGPAEPNWNFTAMWWFFQFNAVGPQVAQAPLDRQNSFRTLMATLGERPIANDIANLADRDSADIVYPDAGSHQIQVDYIWVSDIDRDGDYDVYDLSVSKNQPMAIEVRRANGDLDPIVMVMNAAGTTVLAYDNDGAAGNGARVNFVAKEGESYKVVVGALNNNTTGRYVFESMATEYKVNRRVKPSTDLTIEMNHSSGKN
jgi:hypothetical protein